MKKWLSYYYLTEGKRVWLEVEDWDLPKGGLVVDVGGGAGRLVPYSASSLLSEGSFASAVERMQVTLRTGDSPKARGYRATYKTGLSNENYSFLDIIFLRSLY